MANNIAVKDAAGATQTVKTTDNAGVHTPSQTVDQLVSGQAAHDAVAAGNPVTVGGVASAAAPASVSADGDAVRAWYLRNGAAMVGLQAAGALVGGDATNGLDVDVTRLPKPATGTRSQVADSATDVQILASNANRLGASVFNDSSATLHLGLGTTTVTTTNYTAKLASGAYYEVPGGFTGELRGLWASDPNDGGAKVTELT